MPENSAPATTPRELINAHREPFATVQGGAFQVSPVREFTVGDYPAATYSLGGKFTLAYYAVALTDETVAFMMVSSEDDRADQAEAIALAIVQSISLQPAGTVEPGIVPESGALPLSETYSAPDETVYFDYPAGWQIAVMPTSPGGALPIIVLASSETALSERPDAGMPPDAAQVQIVAGDKTLLLSPMLQATFNDTPAEMLQAYFDLSPMPINVRIDEMTVCDHAAAQFGQAMYDIYSSLQIIDFGDGNAVLFAASVSADAADQWQPTLDAIAASIRFSSEPPTCPAGEA